MIHEAWSCALSKQQVEGRKENLKFLGSLFLCKKHLICKIIDIYGTCSQMSTLVPFWQIANLCLCSYNSPEKMNYTNGYLTIGHYCILYQLAEKYIRDKINCFESFIDVLLSLTLWTGFHDGLTWIRSVSAPSYWCSCRTFTLIPLQE